MKIPCKECITLPICRNKYFPNLNRECAIVNNFLHIKVDECEIRRPSFILRVTKICNLMNSPHWTVFKENGKESYLHYRSDDEKGTFVVNRTMVYYKHDKIGGVTYYP